MDIMPMSDAGPDSLEALKAQLLAIRERIADLEVRKTALEERILSRLFGGLEGREKPKSALQ